MNDQLRAVLGRRSPSFRVFKIVLLAVLASACGKTPEQPLQAPMSVAATLGDENTAGFKKAYGPRKFKFPRDHGAHPDYKNEWWYFTGNVHSPGGREFGFQFTLFRSALAASSKNSGSAWSTRQIYLAHAALTDVEGQLFMHNERFSRGALGLAGVESNPFRAWLDDWQVRSTGPACSNCFSNQLTVETDTFALHLKLENSQAPVLQGDRGLSKKSATPGNASYYYSYPRLQVRGEIIAAQEPVYVSGEGWFDHEWSTSALENWQAGWDWFSVQLSDESELMLYRLRHGSDASKDIYSGSLIATNGEVRQLTRNDINIRAVASWKSPHSGITYPAGWEISLPSLPARLTLQPKLADQEMLLSFRYWEGAVKVTGEVAGNAVSGNGYVELAGYAE